MPARMWRWIVSGCPPQKGDWSALPPASQKEIRRIHQGKTLPPAPIQSRAALPSASGLSRTTLRSQSSYPSIYGDMAPRPEGVNSSFGGLAIPLAKFDVGH